MDIGIEENIVADALGPKARSSTVPGSAALNGHVARVSRG